MSETDGWRVDVLTAAGPEDCSSETTPADTASQTQSNFIEAR